MRKFFATVLAIPVVILIIGGAIVRRPEARRPAVGVMACLGVLLAIAALTAGAFHPLPAAGTRPARVAALPAAELASEVRTGTSPVAPVTISFPGPMNTASVDAQVRVEPAADVDLAWDPSGTILTVTPRSAWTTGVLHTITVESGALDASGRPLDRRIRSSFLTRAATTATIAPTVGATGQVGLETAFRVTFSSPIDASTIEVVVTPAIEGSLAPAADATAATPALVFTPVAALRAGATYSIALAPGARDADGAPIATTSATVRTATAPAVVRFRPVDGVKGVAWSQVLSVRFTMPMDRATTEAAWQASQGSTRVAGTFAWAENDTVLIFDPRAALGYGQKVSMAVGTGARSRAGIPLASMASATFTTAAPPAKPKPRTGGSGGSGGSVGGSTWAAVESYYLKLMNCTRTGGWVTSSGACSSPGGRAVAPLWQDAGISAKVSRPYAKKLVLSNVCSHYSGSTPATRLRAAGYTSYVWAENLGCEGGKPMSAVLGVHLFFQSEKSAGGGHYVNLMNAKYDRVGIGVWVSGSRVRIVIDFYHPL